MCGPFGDPRVHLLVADESTVLNVALCLADRCQKSNFIGNIAIVDIVGKPVDGLKNLLLDAHL